MLLLSSGSIMSLLTVAVFVKVTMLDPSFTLQVTISVAVAPLFNEAIVQLGALQLPTFGVTLIMSSAGSKMSSTTTLGAVHKPLLVIVMVYVKSSPLHTAFVELTFCTARSAHGSGETAACDVLLSSLGSDKSPDTVAMFIWLPVSKALAEICKLTVAL